MPDYVVLERRSLREAEDRADADACSCVVSGPRIVGHRPTEAILAERERRVAEMSQRWKVTRFERRG